MAAGAAIVVLGFASAFVVTSAHAGVVERIKAGAPSVKRWGGYVLVLVGAWFIALGVFADFFARVFPV